MAIQKWRKVNTQFKMQHEAIGSTKHFHSPCEKRVRQRRLHSAVMKFFIVVPLARQNSLVFKDGPIEVVGNAKLVRIQPIRVVKLLIVYVQFNFGKN